MSWSKQKNLFLDVDPNNGQPLLAGTDSQPLGYIPEFIAGDIFPLRIFLRARGSGISDPSTAQTIGETDILTLAGKLTNDITSTSLLFLITSFSSGTDDTYGAYYQGTLDLSGSEIADAITAAGGAIDFTTDLEVKNAGGTVIGTLQFAGKIKPQVYRGTEATPLPSTPVYPPPGEVLTIHSPVFTGSNVRAGTNGTWYAFAPETNLWHALVIAMQDGTAVLTIDPAGISNPA